MIKNKDFNISKLNSFLYLYFLLNKINIMHKNYAITALAFSGHLIEHIVLTLINEKDISI